MKPLSTWARAGSPGARLGRRTLLAAPVLVAAGGAGGCGASEPAPLGAVAYAERSLDVAPLLAAIRAGRAAEPPVRVSLLRRSTGRDVASMVADGTVQAGAMSLPDVVRAAAEGAPLTVAGALTRRLACHLVVATRRAVPAVAPEAVFGGDWRRLRVGVEAGPSGTEAYARALALARDIARPQVDRLLLAPDPAGGEPRWIAYLTGEALVAALIDDRIDAFFGRSVPAAQVISHGAGSLAPVQSGADDVAHAFPTVLVCHRSAADAGQATAPARLLAWLVPSCTREAVALAGPSGADVAMQALPERDPLHLALALRLAAPSPETAAFAVDGRLPPGALERYLELARRAGRPVVGPPAGELITRRYSG